MYGILSLIRGMLSLFLDIKWLIRYHFDVVSFKVIAKGYKYGGATTRSWRSPLRNLDQLVFYYLTRILYHVYVKSVYVCFLLSQFIKKYIRTFFIYNSVMLNCESETKKYYTEFRI